MKNNWIKVKRADLAKTIKLYKAQGYKVQMHAGKKLGEYYLEKIERKDK